MASGEIIEHALVMWVSFHALFGHPQHRSVVYQSILIESLRRNKLVHIEIGAPTIFVIGKVSI